MAIDTETLIKYRIARSKETIAEAANAIDNNFWFNAENRIYYAMFYIVSALAVKNGFSTSKHAQLLGWFNKNFIMTGIVPTKYGKIYQLAFNKRQKGDYEDFLSFEKDEVGEDYQNMLEFIGAIEKLLND